MDDKEWDEFRRWQERTDLSVAIDNAVKGIPQAESKRLKAEFLTCLDAGGVESSYAIADVIEGGRLPLLYPLVAEHFVRVRRPPLSRTKRERSQHARALRQVAKKLEDVSQLALSITDGPSWCVPMAQSLQPLAGAIARLVSEDEVSESPDGPGRPMKVGTPLAIDLNALFGKSELSIPRRCEIIAAVVTAFVEPVTGEQIRQRFKDFRRRPRPA